MKITLLFVSHNNGIFCNLRVSWCGYALNRFLSPSLSRSITLWDVAEVSDEGKHAQFTRYDCVGGGTNYKFRVSR